MKTSEPHFPVRLNSFSERELSDATVELIHGSEVKQIGTFCVRPDHALPKAYTIVMEVRIPYSPGDPAFRELCNHLPQSTVDLIARHPNPATAQFVIELGK